MASTISRSSSSPAPAPAPSPKVFDALDEDKSGALEYKELNVMLRKGAGSELTKARLKRAPSQKDTGRGAKLTAKNVNQNYVGMRSPVLPTMVTSCCLHLTLA